MTARRCFAKDRSGAAMLEFALLLPLLLSLFLGQFELVSAVRANLKVQSAANALANLIATQGTISPSQIADYCSGARLMLAPLPGAPLAAAIASVTEGASSPKIDWQDGSCGGAAAIGNPASLAGGAVSLPGDSVILVQATYVYHSPVGYLLSSPLSMTQTAIARPRSNKTIPHS